MPRACRQRSRRPARSFRKATRRPTCWRPCATRVQRRRRSALDEPAMRSRRDTARAFTSAPPARGACEKLLITTGGQSYPGCGTVGDGYGWAARLGHTIIPPRTGTGADHHHRPWVRGLGGITMPDVQVRVVEPADSWPGDRRKDRRVLAERRGSLLFAHFGLSGPVVLDVSRAVSGHAARKRCRWSAIFCRPLARVVA